LIEGASPAITLTGVSLSYEGRKVLNNICLEAVKGAYYGIVGPNGSGKTTLAYIIAGILKPDTGTVDTHGNRVGLILTNPENQVVSLVVEEDIAFGPENLNLPSAEIQRRIDSALRATHSEGQRTALTSALSGGQLAKVVFAGQLAMDTDVLILDEGTVMLDPANRAILLETIRELNRNLKKTIIHISHRLDDLEAADHILGLAGGEIAHQAPGVLPFIREYHTGIPGIEPGPYLLYREFLSELGISGDSLEETTKILARRMQGTKAQRH
jgi:energy-coupling factor transport system ATP-binding protein